MAQIEIKNIDPDKSYLIEEQVKHKNTLPAFDLFGGNTSVKTSIPNYPSLYKTIQNMSRSASWLWWELIQGCDRVTNITYYRPVDKVAANRLSRGYKELNQLDLVKRTQPRYYIINPVAYIPLPSKFDEVVTYWKTI